MKTKGTHEQAVLGAMAALRAGYRNVYREQGGTAAAASLFSQKFSFGSPSFREAADRLIVEWRAEDQRCAEDTADKWLELLTREQK